MRIPHHKRMARALTHTRTHTGQPYARVSRLFAAIPLLSTCPASRQPASPVQLPTLRHRVRIACACRSPLKLVAIAWRGLSRRHARFYFVVVFLQCVCVFIGAYVSGAQIPFSAAAIVWCFSTYPKTVLCTLGLACGCVADWENACACAATRMRVACC